MKSMWIKAALGTVAAVGALFGSRESQKQRTANNAEQVEIRHYILIFCKAVLDLNGFNGSSLFAVRDGKTEDKDLLSDLQDVSDSERKTSTPESSLGTSLLVFDCLCVCLCQMG